MTSITACTISVFIKSIQLVQERYGCCNSLKWRLRHGELAKDVCDYWNVSNEIHAAENLLFVGDRLIVPATK